MSSSVHVTVSPASRIIVFSGNLLKAPPLNRRGRKKWHERYFLLRANKTIEIHKSRKAAEAQKAPRRVIDLRECISLELGLEYKNLQHILSIGTFKRTFFLAAPSNALMLQWGNVLEKVKNAEGGESIEVLDIGLRNTRNCNPVHRVKPPESTQPFLPTSLSTPTSPKKIWANLYTKGVSKSTFAISNFSEEARNDAYGNRGSGNVGYTSYYTSPNHRARSSSLSNQDTYGQEHSYHSRFHGRLPQVYSSPRMANSSIEMGDPRERGRFSGGSSNTSSSGPSPSHAPLIGGKIPPPSVMLKGWGGTPNEGSSKHSSHEGSSFEGEEDMQREDQWRRDNGKEFVAREGLLRRSEAFRTQSSKRVPPSESDMGGIWGGRRTSEDSSKGRTQNDTNSSLLRSTPLKQSCHYRKIELQAEPPLFEQKEDEEGSSDEDMDSVVSDVTGKYSPGFFPMSSTTGKAFHSMGRDAYHSPLSIPARLEMHGRRRNYSGPPISGRSGTHGYPSAWSRDRLEMVGRGYLGGSGGGSSEGSWNGSGLGLGNGSPFSNRSGQSSPRQPHSLSRIPPQVPEATTQRFYSLEGLERNLQEERANTYCQVTVGKRDEGAVSGITATRAGIPNAKLDNILSKSQHSSMHSFDDDVQTNPSSTYENEIREQEENGKQQQRNTENHFPDNFEISPPVFDEFSTNFQLPARGSESFLYDSPEGMTPPIDEIIAPPLNFEHATMTTIVNETIPEEGESQGSDNDHTESKTQNLKLSAVTADRHSTESCDTGYTSGQGQSPGYSERRNLTTVNEFPQASAAELPSTNKKNERNSPPSTAQGTVSELSASMSSIQNSHSGYSIRHSQTSFASTDSIRFYVPFVFQKSGRAAKLRRNSSKTSLFLLVCLVENSDHLIKELLSQKVAGGYRVVECEGEEGKSVVSAGDDFTVETALEDLEFGFSITTSTQKDVYINKAKVREFQFQIDNLFGCLRKPFSCDVMIRHADQITVLPIEVETAE